MSIELPHEYQPSEDEEFMSPRQVQYFRRRLSSRAQTCGGNLLRVCHRTLMTAAGRETRPTMPVQLRNENLRPKTASGCRVAAANGTSAFDAWGRHVRPLRRHRRTD